MKGTNKEKNIDFSRYIIYEDGKMWSKHWDREIKGYVNRNGYIQVSLKDISGKWNTYSLHRVIWYYFNGEIPEDLQVNHKDEDKTNNRLSNLNLMTPKENCNWGTRNERAAKTQSLRRKGTMLGEDNPNWGNRWSDEQRKHLSDLCKGKYLNEKSVKSKKVLQLTLDGELVKEWPSTMECKRNGYNQGLVAECCRGGRWRNGKWIKMKTYKGYRWKYAST